MFLTRLTSSLTQLTRTDISGLFDVEADIWETTPECEYLVFDEFGDLVTYNVNWVVPLFTEDGNLLATEDGNLVGLLGEQTYNIRCIVPLFTEDGNLLATEDGNLVGLLGDSLV